MEKCFSIAFVVLLFFATLSLCLDKFGQFESLEEQEQWLARHAEKAVASGDAENGWIRLPDDFPKLRKPYMTTNYDKQREYKSFQFLDSIKDEDLFSMVIREKYSLVLACNLDTDLCNEYFKIFARFATEQARLFKDKSRYPDPYTETLEEVDNAMIDFAHIDTASSTERLQTLIPYESGFDPDQFRKFEFVAVLSFRDGQLQNWLEIPATMPKESFAATIPHMFRQFLLPIQSWEEISPYTEDLGELKEGTSNDLLYAVMVLFGGNMEDEAHIGLTNFISKHPEMFYAVTILDESEAERVLGSGYTGPNTVQIYYGNNVSSKPFSLNVNSRWQVADLIRDNLKEGTMPYSPTSVSYLFKQLDKELVIMGITPLEDENARKYLLDTLDGVREKHPYAGFIYSDSSFLSSQWMVFGDATSFPTAIALQRRGLPISWNSRTEFNQEELNKWINQIGTGTFEQDKKSSNRVNEHIALEHLSYNGFQHTYNMNMKMDRTMIVIFSLADAKCHLCVDKTNLMSLAKEVLEEQGIEDGFRFYFYDVSDNSSQEFDVPQIPTIRLYKEDYAKDYVGQIDLQPFMEFILSGGLLNQSEKKHRPRHDEL